MMLFDGPPRCRRCSQFFQERLLCLPAGVGRFYVLIRELERVQGSDHCKCEHIGHLARGVSEFDEFTPLLTSSSALADHANAIAVLMQGIAC